MSHAPLPAAAPLVRLLETALYVNDLDASRQFYGEVLGLVEILCVPDRHVFFRLGDMVLLLFNPVKTILPANNPQLPVPTHGAIGQGHLCFALPREDMASWRARLDAAGVAIEAEFDWPNGARSVYFRDPDGNSLELAEPGLWFDDPAD